MIEVHSKALDQHVEIDRIIYQLKGDQPGPTLVFMGGIHGNEPAGVFALKSVIEQLEPSAVRGSVYALAGNLSALRKSIRFNEEDLNRVWTADRMEKLSNDPAKAKNLDEVEQIEINETLQSILESEEGPFYFFDIHTTSSETLPFLTVNDSLLNRAFTAQFPLPIILGIEEYLEGPILSYLNELGYVAFGFEAGQHDELAAIENAVAFIYLALVFAGALPKTNINYQKYYDHMAKTTGGQPRLFEITYRHLIKNGEKFQMLPGFFNFQKIIKKQPLAESNGQILKAKHAGRIFMPLYQPQESDGFFTIQKIWKPFLNLSAFIRKHRLDRLLVTLPGVSWVDKKKSGLFVNRKVARFLAKDLFHLFGYRSATVDENRFKMSNRESSAKYQMYEAERWYHQ